MILDRSHFALELPFAERVAAVTGIPLDAALLRYTQFYNVGLGQGWDFDPANPVWGAFLAAVDAGANPVDYVYNQYRLSPHDSGHAGCFSYEWRAGTRTVRLHFVNNAPDGLALRESEMAKRHTELHDMSAAVAAEHPEAERVCGGSWLYNLEVYRRLFPPEFIAALHEIEREYFALGVWGQFLDRHGAVKPALRDTFLACVAAATTMDELDACFPLPTLATECEIAVFYRHYGVAPPERMKG